MHHWQRGFVAAMLVFFSIERLSGSNVKLKML
jgi:hypothetical protein